LRADTADWLKAVKASTIVVSISQAAADIVAPMLSIDPGLPVKTHALAVDLANVMAIVMVYEAGPLVADLPIPLLGV
jgi:hypothetical protein